MSSVAEPFGRKARWAVLGLVLLGGCQKEHPPEPPPEPAVTEPEPSGPEVEDWRAERGAVRVTQLRRQDGTCRISSQGGTAWEVTGCQGDKTALAFTDRRGERVILLITLPRLSDDDDGTVLALLDHGRLVRAGLTRDFLGKKAHVVRFSSHFAWLSGTVQLPGRAPSLKGDRVAFSTVEGKSFSVGFDGTGIPELAPSTPQAACDGVYEWVDREGTHFTNNLMEIPERYRQRARCSTGGEVGTIANTSPRGPPPRMARPSASSDNSNGSSEPTPPPAAATKVFCKFKYILGTNWTERSFCTSGSVSEATDACNASAKAMNADVAPCWCTDDAEYIGTRC